MLDASPWRTAVALLLADGESSPPSGEMSWTGGRIDDRPPSIFHFPATVGITRGPVSILRGRRAILGRGVIALRRRVSILRRRRIVLRRRHSILRRRRAERLHRDRESRSHRRMLVRARSVLAPFT